MLTKKHWLPLQQKVISDTDERNPLTHRGIGRRGGQHQNPNGSKPSNLVFFTPPPPPTHKPALFLGNFWILDADGLLTEARVSSVDKLTQRFARPADDGEMAEGAGVEEVSTTLHIGL